MQDREDRVINPVDPAPSARQGAAPDTILQRTGAPQMARSRLSRSHLDTPPFADKLSHSV